MHLDERAGELNSLIRDRGANFTTSFDAVFTAAGTHHQDPGPDTPVQRNSRTVESSCRREATDKILILGEQHLRTVLTEYVDHYDGHRPHRTLQQRPPDAPDQPPSPPGNLPNIVRQNRLGGLINEYSQVA